ALERVVIVRVERLVPLPAQIAHLRLDRRLVDARDGMVLVRLDAERLAQRGQQMILVHLRVALHGVPVLDAFGDLAQVLNRLLFQLMKRVSHEASGNPSLYRGLKSSATPFMQYRSPVGAGPSGNTCPR